MPTPAKFLQIILVTGDDRIAFLQGQLSCEMVNAEGSIQLATMCNPKGRIITIFHVICTSEAVYLVARADLIEPASTHLKRFVFRSKVQISHQHSINVFLSDTTSNPEHTLLIPGTIEELNNSTVRARLANPNTVELTLSTNANSSVIGDFTSNDSEQNAESFWSYQMHASAIPELTLEQSEKYLPEPLNLDLSGGISFEKGCYTGQEVIARMHYLGKAKKRLYQFATNNPITINGGMSVFDQQGNNIGEVLSVTADYKSLITTSPIAASHSEKSLIGLAILTRHPPDNTIDSETHQYWINQAPDEPDSISIKASFPKY